MISIIKTEFYKLKRYSILWIGFATMLTVVLLSRFMATAADGTVHTFKNFSNNVIWNNFSLIFPATITLIAGYIMNREFTDDTLKNILVIPISFRKILLGKLLTVGILAILLGFLEFAFTTIVFLLSGFPEFTLWACVSTLLQMVGMNIFVYIAVLPIIALTAQKSGSFMPGVAFALFYGYIGSFASGHGLGDLYPITAGLGLINYQSGEPISYNLFIECIVLISILCITAIILFNAKDRGIVVKKTKKRNRRKGA